MDCTKDRPRRTRESDILAEETCLFSNSQSEVCEMVVHRTQIHGSHTYVNPYSLSCSDFLFSDSFPKAHSLR